MKTRLSCVFAVRITLLIGLVVTIAPRVRAEEASDFQRKISATNPVAHWSFTQPDVLTDGATLTPGPRGPLHSGFSVGNTGIGLKDGAHLVIPDEGVESRFDFAHGDSFSVEAMVNPTELKGYSAILSKGRTSNAGFPSDNQNWAFRLTSVGGKAGVNFLFRSRADEHGPGDWHRWTGLLSNRPRAAAAWVPVSALCGGVQPAFGGCQCIALFRHHIGRAATAC